MSRKSPREQLHTQFANSGRIAGDGMRHDNYSEDSGNKDYEARYRDKPVMFLSDYLSKEEQDKLYCSETVTRRAEKG
jgi:hypothetical protein